MSQLCMYEYRNAITCVAISDNGTMLATSDFDGTIYLYDNSTHKLVATLKKERALTTDTSGSIAACLAFTSDNNLLISGDYGCINTWSLTTTPPTLLKTLRHRRTGWISSVAVHPDCSVIASGERSGGIVRIWNIEHSTCTHVLHGDSGGTVNAVGFSPNGRHLASGGSDDNVCIWDTTTYALINTLKARNGTVNTIAYSPDGSMLASGHWSRKVIIYDAKRYLHHMTLEGHKDDVTSIVFTPDSSVIISASDDKTIRGWDTTSMAQLYVWEGHRDCVSSVAVSPNGSWLVSGSKDKSVREWELNRPSAAVLSLIKPVCHHTSMDDKDDDGEDDVHQ